MKVLFYSSSKTKVCKRALKTILTIIPEDFLEAYHTIRSLSGRLMEPLGDLSIAILWISNQKEFSSLLTIKDLLKDIRIILILPDREKTTVSKGHHLGARFSTYKDNDFSDVVAIIKNMVEKTDVTRGSRKNHHHFLQV